jgi:BASS family bile acid:Na+ symporter
MFEYTASTEYLLAKIQLVLFMLGMGATLRPADFLAVARQPRWLIIGGIFQFIVTPGLAVLLGTLARVEEGIGVGLILISAMPGGQMSKLFTYLARGNVALSITLTAAGTLASVVTAPLLLGLLASDWLQRSDFEMPVGHMLADVACYLLLPLCCGMVFGRVGPRWRARFSKTCIRVGLVFVAVMIIGSVTSGRIQPAAYGWKTPLTIIVFCVLTMQLSLLPFRVLSWPKADAVAVGMEATMRNINLALLLKALLFPLADDIGNGVLFVVLFYGATALLAAVPLALRYRRSIMRLDNKAVLDICP